MYKRQPLPDQPQPSTSFGEWYKHKPGAWVGTGVVAVGLIIGIAGSAVASGASSTSNADVAAVQLEIANRHDPPNVCNSSVQAASPALAAHYAGACAVVQGDINNYHTGVAVSAVGWTFFSLGLVGTGVYAAVDYPRWKRKAADSAAPPPAAVLPMVSPTFKGVGVVGSF